MAGNVWEWMDKLYDENSGARSVRGGSWYDFTDVLPCDYRFRDNPVNWDLNMGFRVVRAQSSF